MSGENEMVQDVATDAPAESVVSGEPQGSTETSGESVNQEAKSGEPSGEGLFDGMTPEKLHKSYKSLQSEYTKAQEAVKKLEKYGGPDQLVQWADYLSNNQEFANWVQSQQNKNILGVKEDEMDDATKQALDTVRKLSRAEAEAIVRDVMKKEIAPLSEGYKQQIIEKHFETMDTKYGKEWHEMRDTMSELSSELPQNVQDRPTYEDMEDLYFKALRKTGKMETYAKKMYAKELESKKSKATERPSQAPQSGDKQYSSIQEAFAAAKRAHNMT